MQHDELYDINQEAQKYLSCRRFKKVTYKLRIIDSPSLLRSFNDPPMSNVR